MTPGMLFVKEWRIHNVGTVPWQGRRLERQGPLTGPGLITSMRHVEIPDTGSGEIAEMQAVLQAPGYDCTSIAYFKMVDEEGFLCFPDEHQLGLDVLVRVERNTGGSQ
jgi:Ig-like domain from next to BRCA1 gene